MADQTKWQLKYYTELCTDTQSAVHRENAAITEPRAVPMCPQGVQSALEEASAEGHASVVRRLLSLRPDLLMHRRAWYMTGQMSSALPSQMSILCWLGAGRTNAIRLACRYDMPESLRELLRLPWDNKVRNDIIVVGKTLEGHRRKCLTDVCVSQ